MEKSFAFTFNNKKEKRGKKLLLSKIIIKFGMIKKQKENV